MRIAEKRGQGTFEYVLMIGGVVLVVLLAMAALPKNQVDKGKLCAIAAREDLACFYANGTFNNYSMFYFNADKKSTGCNCTIYQVQPGGSGGSMPTSGPTAMPVYPPETTFTVNLPIQYGAQTCNLYNFDASDPNNYLNCQQVTNKICQNCFTGNKDPNCQNFVGPTIPSSYQYGSSVHWPWPDSLNPVAYHKIQPKFVCIGPASMSASPFFIPSISYGQIQTFGKQPCNAPGPSDPASTFACVSGFNATCVNQFQAKGGILTGWDANGVSGFCMSKQDSTNVPTTFALPLTVTLTDINNNPDPETCTAPAANGFFTTNCRAVYDKKCIDSGHILGGIPISWDPNANTITGFCFA